MADRRTLVLRTRVPALVVRQGQHVGYGRSRAGPSTPTASWWAVEPWAAATYAPCLAPRDEANG